MIQDGPSKIIKLLFLILLVVLMTLCCYGYHLNKTYKDIIVVMNENAAIEYGAANYNLEDLIQKVDGKIISIRNDIDTGLIGEQEVVLEVKKENIVKDIPLMISIVDTNEPVIQLKKEKVIINQGDDYCLLDNIDYVKDDIDGDIPYSLENDNFYYRFQYDQNTIDDVGEHEVSVVAVDKNGKKVAKKASAKRGFLKSSILWRKTNLTEAILVWLLAAESWAILPGFAPGCICAALTLLWCLQPCFQW